MEGSHSRSRDDTCRASASPSRYRDSARLNGRDRETDTENWLQVRKILLQTPKFSRCLEEISETEWLQSRAPSLKILLDCCSNVHGGPSGELWNTITSTLTHCMGPQHNFIKLISEHQENLWTTCSLVTVTTLSEDLSLDDTGNWGESVSQMSVSAPANESHKAYGSIELLEPTEKDGHRVCMHPFHWKWLLLYIPLLLALVAVIAVAVTFAKMKPEATQKVETLEATTVYLDTQKSIWYKGWQVSDCTESTTKGGNNLTASNIQLVDSDDVVYYDDNVVADETEGYQNVQLLKTLDGPLYLLAGSSVEYQFCLSTNFSESVHPHIQQIGEFLIFNDITSYTNYIHQSGHRGKEAAIFYQETPIIAREKTCTNVTCSISQADLYFIMYKLPPHVELHYRSNIHVVYLNYTNYIAKEEGECKLKMGGSCEIQIPENTFSSEDYTLLAYMPLQPSSVALNSTQLCVTPKQSVLVSIIPGVIAACVLLLLTVVLVCQFISFLGNLKRRKGYFCIKPINV